MRAPEFALWSIFAVVFFSFGALSFLSALAPASSGNIPAAVIWLVCSLLFFIAGGLSLSIALKAAAMSS
jgi:hypothetical protein